MKRIVKQRARYLEIRVLVVFVGGLLTMYLMSLVVRVGLRIEDIDVAARAAKSYIAPFNVSRIQCSSQG